MSSISAAAAVTPSYSFTVDETEPPAAHAVGQRWSLAAWPFFGFFGGRPPGIESLCTKEDLRANGTGIWSASCKRHRGTRNNSRQNMLEGKRLKSTRRQRPWLPVSGERLTKVDARREAMGSKCHESIITCGAAQCVADGRLCADQSQVRHDSPISWVRMRVHLHTVHARFSAESVLRM